MPTTKSAKKRLRQNEKRRKRNKAFEKKMKEAIKEVRDLVEDGNLEKAKEKLPEAYKHIDKAAKKGIIKKQNASRKKSRLAKKIDKAKTQK